MESMISVGLLFVILILISVLIARWIFRINKIVALLEGINEKLRDKGKTE